MEEPAAERHAISGERIPRECVSAGASWQPWGEDRALIRLKTDSVAMSGVS